MARQEQDREDLLREAVALVERIEVKTAREQSPVVIGFRRDAAASVYFDGDPAYHFNTLGELRRAYVQGRLWKAEQGRIVAMSRLRTGGEVQLQALPLSPEEQSVALFELRARLARLCVDLQASATYTVVGQAPPGNDVLSRIRRWLQELPVEIAVAQRPNVAG